VIAGRVTMRGADSDLPLSEQVRPVYVDRLVCAKRQQRCSIAEPPHGVRWSARRRSRRRWLAPRSSLPARYSSRRGLVRRKQAGVQRARCCCGHRVVGAER
jgi:hypothetical protein